MLPEHSLPSDFLVDMCFIQGGNAIALLSLIPVRNGTRQFVAFVPSSTAILIFLSCFVYKIRPFANLYLDEAPVSCFTQGLVSPLVMLRAP